MRTQRGKAQPDQDWVTHDSGRVSYDPKTRDMMDKDLKAREKRKGCYG